MELSKFDPNNLSPRAVEEYKLVQEAINGSQKAYTELVNRYKLSIYHMMLKMVNNREDADDLVMEAFGKAFSKLPSYTPRYAFSTWLFKIAINNSIDFIRKKKINTLSIDESLDKSESGGSNFSHNMPSNLPDPEQKYIQEQRIKLMRNILRKLNVKYRLMVELRYFEDRSYEEIAQELEIPLGTVKAQLFRAKEILYTLLQTPEARNQLDMIFKVDKD